MHISTHKNGNLHGSWVVREKSLFSLLELSIHAHTPHTSASEALRLVYTAALLAGCGTYAKDNFLDALATLGSQIQVTSSGDSINISLSARNENTRKTLTLFKTMLEKPTFSAKEITRIKKNLTNNLNLAKEDARARARDQFVNELISKDDRRYIYDIDTTIKEVHKVTRAQLLAFHTQLNTFDWNYTCGGNKQSCTSVTKTLIALSSTQAIAGARNGASVRVISAPVLKLLNIPHKQNIEWSIGGPLTITSTSPDFAPLFFGIAVLGIYGGFSGRFMSTVREKEGLTYTIYAQIEGVSSLEMGYWRIMTFFSPKDTVRGITSTIREITSITEKGITDDELKRFKAILKTRFAMVEDSLIKKVREVHGYTEGGLTSEQFDSFKSEIQSMTRAKVNTALKKYLNPKALIMSGGGPVDSVRAELEKFKK